MHPSTLEYAIAVAREFATAVEERRPCILNVTFGYEVRSGMLFLGE